MFDNFFRDEFIKIERKFVSTKTELLNLIDFGCTNIINLE